MLAVSTSNSTRQLLGAHQACAARLAPRRITYAPLHAVNKNMERYSFDGDDESMASGNNPISREFADVADPKRIERMKEHLKLVWKVNQLKRPEPCECCSGSGEQECGWCHGTGVMTVGDQIFLSNSAKGSECPVCKAKGYVKCEHCRGIGRRAQWLDQPGCSVPKI